MLVSEVSDLSRWNLKGPHPFSLSPDSASEPRLLARPLLSSSFFRNLQIQENIKILYHCLKYFEAVAHRAM